MQCPKCGVYLEDDRDTCFMCGATIANNSDSNMFNNEFSNNTENNFSSEYLAKKEEYENRFNDYKKINIDNYNNDKQDIFDFFSKHKKTVRIVSIILIILVVSGIIYAIAKYKIDSKKTKPVLVDLYYEVDDAFNVQGNKNAMQYSKTITGGQCIIIIYSTKDSSSNHAAQYFSEMKKNIEPQKDNEGNIKNPLEEYLEKTGSRTINGVDWQTLNISYRADVDSSSFSVLKYRYLSATYNGYSYDIVLSNEKNNQSCAIDLENFAQTLKFIEKE